MRETLKESANMLLYFWEEKGDFTRYTGYRDFKQNYPDESYYLNTLKEQVRMAEMQISNYLKLLVNREEDEKKQA